MQTIRFVPLTLGFLAFCLALMLLLTSEKRARDRYRALEGGLDQVRTAEPSLVDPINEGYLVRLEGTVTTDQILVDPLFEVKANALRLRRQVEMLQWHESWINEEPQYHLAFSDTMIDSSRFLEPAGHENPAEPAYPELVTDTSAAQLGVFELPDNVLKNLVDWESWLPEDTSKLDELGFHRVTEGGRDFFYPKPPSAIGLGDIRVAFEVVKPVAVSLLGIQQDNTLKHFRGGGKLGFLVIKRGGVHLLPAIDRGSPPLVWSLRLGGALLMFGAMLGFFGAVGASRARSEKSRALALTIGLGAVFGAWMWWGFAGTVAIVLAVVGTVFLFFGALRRSSRRTPVVR